eukprot:6175909-Pleurochrysis_carterae.AAC.1
MDTDREVQQESLARYVWVGACKPRHPNSKHSIGTDMRQETWRTSSLTSLKLATASQVSRAAKTKVGIPRSNSHVAASRP